MNAMDSSAGAVVARCYVVTAAACEGRATPRRQVSFFASSSRADWHKITVCKSTTREHTPFYHSILGRPSACESADLTCRLDLEAKPGRAKPGPFSKKNLLTCRHVSHRRTFR